MEKLFSIIKKNKVIINNIGGAFIIRGGALILSLFTMPAYMNYFNNQIVLGLWFTILSVLNWVLMFDLGLGNGLRNKLPIAMAENDDKKVKAYISSTYISTAILIVVLSIMSYLVFQYIPWNTIFNIDSSIISHDTLVLSVKIVFIGIMIQFLLKLITSILYAIQKSALVNLLSLISSIIILISVLCLKTTDLENSLITMSWINVIAVNLPLLVVTIIIFSTVLKKSRPSFRKYNNRYALEILKIGSVLLWLQLVFMVISSTNEFLISFFTTPYSVVEYQTYNKIFNAVSSLFTLALAPIWSAVTKAQADRDFNWIKKLSNVLFLTGTVVLLLEFAMVPFLQILIDVWLGKGTIKVETTYAIIFVISNSIFIFHNINTSIGNGMSYFKTQIIWMTFAAIVNIPLAYLLVNITGGWIGVVLANIISLLPFEIMQPIYMRKHINTLILRENRTTINI
ncbi:MAG: hypothetical protein E6582_16245 [Clostridium sp.]|uniref:lipopolysaccharide biosynthesis protein n=1 Tax=Clostridium sp. TaxID=1506 RepID=UPI002906227B|nr:hypothetical protein [Clostridium sp.]MDU6365060.1 hypothetical protein [Clostridium sp.]